MFAKGGCNHFWSFLSNILHQSTVSVFDHSLGWKCKARRWSWSFGKWNQSAAVYFVWCQLNNRAIFSWIFLCHCHIHSLINSPKLSSAMRNALSSISTVYVFSTVCNGKTTKCWSLAGNYFDFFLCYVHSFTFINYRTVFGNPFRSPLS